MPKVLNAFIFAGALFFSQSASAVIRTETPKSVKQGSVIKVVIQDPGGGPHEVHFCPVGWPTDRNGTKKNCIAVDTIDIGGGKQIALIPVGVSEESGMGLVSIFSLSEAHSLPIEIQKVDFPESKKTFYVPEPTPEILKKSKEQRAFLDEIYARITPKRYFSGNLRFQNPLEKMEMVSNADFGQVRKKVLISRKTHKALGRWKDYHNGIDFLAFVGTPVFVAESGKIVAARNLLGSGNTVIIDHGYGLVSLYFHLSKIYVKEGYEIYREERIGLAGMSGNAKGPHLHFEVRLFGVPVNPFEFLSGGAK